MTQYNSNQNPQNEEKHFVGGAASPDREQARPIGSVCKSSKLLRRQNMCARPMTSGNNSRSGAIAASDFQGFFVENKTK